jgi:hypothetical protein
MLRRMRQRILKTKVLRTVMDGRDTFRAGP